MCVNFDTQIKCVQKCELNWFTLCYNWKTTTGWKQSNTFLLPILTTSAKSIMHLYSQIAFFMSYSYCRFGSQTPCCQSYMVLQRTVPIFPYFWHLFSFLGKHREESERKNGSVGQTHADHQGTAAGFHVIGWTAQLEPEKLFEKRQTHLTGTDSSLPSCSGLGSWNNFLL